MNKINKFFYENAKSLVVAAMLMDIANNYRITQEEAVAELLNDDAEFVLEYLTSSRILVYRELERLSILPAQYKK